MKNKFKFAIASSITALLLVSLAHADPQALEKTFEVNSGGTLYLKSDSGSIEIESQASNKVEIEVKVSGDDAEDFEVAFSKEGNDVRITGERNGGYGSSHIRARFIVKIPKNYNVDLRTGGGSIDLADLKGKVDARTSGGSISLGSIEGDVDVNTSGGSIRVEEVAGNINAHTSGGSIKATLSQQPTDNCKLNTSGGSITAYLASDIAVDLSASTSGGRVSSDFDVDGTVGKKRMHGKINGGGPKLDLRTSGGSVRVKKT